MDRISLDNIFNYIPSGIRKAQNDDDQLKSWAMQAFRLFNFNNMKYVKDIISVEVKNHKFKLPIVVKKIDTVDFLGMDNIAVYEQLLVDYPELDITYLDKNQYKDIFYSLRPVQPQAYNYYCKVEDNKNIYAPTDDPRVYQVPYLEGCVLVQFYREYAKDDDILLPEEPEVLWMFLSSYVQMKHWEDRKSYKEEGSNQQYQQAQFETVNKFDACKRELVWRNFSIENAKRTIYGESYGFNHLSNKLIDFYSHVKY
jgi:hypothetical protein